jgi:hypothetical protein
VFYNNITKLQKFIKKFNQTNKDYQSLIENKSGSELGIFWVTIQAASDIQIETELMNS